MTDKIIPVCEICGKAVVSYKPQESCNTFDGDENSTNINPVICSNECYEKYLKGDSK